MRQKRLPHRWLIYHDQYVCRSCYSFLELLALVGKKIFKFLGLLVMFFLCL